MKSLQPSAADETIEILPGIIVTLSPIASFDMAVIKNEVQKYLDDLEKGVEVVGAAGLLISEEYDPSNPVHVQAMRSILTIKKIGTRHIKAWTGIKGATGDEDLPPTPENIENALNNWAFSQVFYEKVMAREYLNLVAKKKSMTDPHGTAEEAAESVIATNAA